MDANPPLAPSGVSNGSNRIVVETTAGAGEDALEFWGGNAKRWRMTQGGNLLPNANAAYDIGSAEYKVRDLYLDNGSLHTASGKNLSFHDGNLTWGGDDIIMLDDLKQMMAEATSFEEFKNAILGL